MREGHDPLGLKAGARFVTERSEHVAIDKEAVMAFCQALAEEGVAWTPEWDAGLHFSGSEEQTIAYVFVLDTVNFCFWGDPKWRRPHRGQMLDGYWALAAALTEQAEVDPAFLEAESLATMDAARLEGILRGSPAIPLLAARAANLRALGLWVGERFGGLFGNVLRASRADAVELVRLVVNGLESFRDETTYRGRLVPFYKRAQILAADLHGAFRGEGWGRLARISDLTAFADYKLPQILRHEGILRYGQDLAARVDAQNPIPAGSPEEVEIRANTIWAVELIVQELERVGVEVMSYQVDWLLWLASQNSGAMKPYHRTVTIFY